MDLLTSKIVVAILLGSVRFFFGLLPIKIHHLLLKWEQKEDEGPIVSKRRHQRVRCILVMCQSFSGGVLFASCFLHMMPEVFVSVEELKRYTGSESEYPVSQLIICFGFLMIYFVEEGSHWLITKIPQRPLECKSAKNNKVEPEDDKKSGDVYVIEYGEKDEKMEKMVEEKNEKNSGDSEESKELEKIVEEEVITQQYVFRAIITLSALALHAILEGMSIGLQSTSSNVWYMFVAVAIHSSTILFCLGCEMLLVKTRLRYIVINIAILSFMSTIGVTIGLLVTLKYAADSKAKTLAVLFLDGLSAGTILYITFFEALNREKHRRVYRMRRAICILAGFLIMAILQTL